ncbi:MAG: hypothetical protein ABSH06_00275 [Thermodesulfobacteriota bacterium]
MRQTAREMMMPTNRKRKMRISNRVPLTFTDEYIGHLKVSDFLGELTEEEIPVAKELGVYQWDAWCKERRERRL